MDAARRCAVTSAVRVSLSNPATKQKRAAESTLGLTSSSKNSHALQKYSSMQLHGGSTPDLSNLMEKHEVHWGNFGGKKEWALTLFKNFSIFSSKFLQSIGALNRLGNYLFINFLISTDNMNDTSVTQYRCNMYQCYEYGNSRCPISCNITFLCSRA
jgi:hypothetical protein